MEQTCFASRQWLEGAPGPPAAPMHAQAAEKAPEGRAVGAARGLQGYAEAASFLWHCSQSLPGLFAQSGINT